MTDENVVLSLLIALLVGCALASPRVLANGPGSSAINATLAASADAYVDQAQPQRNFGSSALLNTRSLRGGNARVYIAFNLSSIPPGAQVLSARLVMYVGDPPPSQRTYFCYRVASSWDEGSVSWATHPQSSSLYGSSCVVGPSAGWATWDLTGQVQKMLNGIPEHAWPNLGWEISDGAEDSAAALNASLCSREFTPELNRPSFVVRFNPPKINLTSASTTMMPRTWVQVAAKRVSQGGVLVTVADRTVLQDWINKGSLTIDLSSTSPTGRFSTTQGGQPVSRITIPDGSTQVSFYYYDETVGRPTIRASTSDYPQGYYLADSRSIEVMVDATAPMITNVIRTPESPVMGETVRVSASVTDPESGVKEVILRYSVGAPGTWVDMAMSLQGGVYVGQIPAQSAFAEVRYLIRASDNSGNVAETTADQFSAGVPIWAYGALVLLAAIAVLVGLRVLKKGKS